MTQTTTRPAIGSTATLQVIAGDDYQVNPENAEEVGFRPESEFQFLSTRNPMVRTLQLLAVGARFEQGIAEAGITSTDDELIVIRMAEKEEDAEGYVLNGDDFTDGDEIDLTTVALTRVF